MQTFVALEPLRLACRALRGDGPLALVPTMGALHAGHLALVREAQARAAHVVVSIFVNPRQFGAGEDLGSYPRQLARDAAVLEAAGVSALWAPPAEVMYPHGYATTVQVGEVSEGLCGAVRPGHFDGVATVVAKLFNQVGPDLAVFGEKDWQQLAVIRKLARDLDLSHPRAEAIVAVAIVREADGLALSSRNAYLSAEQRSAAAQLPRAMKTAIAEIAAGETYHQALATLTATLLDGGFAAVDYAEVRDSDSFERQTVAGPPGSIGRLLVAARIGTTRLIDNMALAPPSA